MQTPQSSETGNHKRVPTLSTYSEPMILTNGDYTGTLAATRSLGRKGVPVYLADEKTNCASAGSRFVSKFYNIPKQSRLDKVASYLLQKGELNKGAVLYPTSDDMAWTYAKNAESLAKHYNLYQPSLDVIYLLLNKRKLYKNAQDLGIEVPTSFYPSSLEELNNIKKILNYPVLLKPKTQIGLTINTKGIVCLNEDELMVGVHRITSKYNFLDEMLAFDPDLKWPMIQTFIPEANSNIYSLGGFIAKGGNHFVVRASKKLLQQPIRVGVGMAFESRPLNQDLVNKLESFCKKIGYYGIFEVEFIHIESLNKYLLIDFNPRLYGQIGFEIARNLPAPYLVYLAATGHDEQLAEQIAVAKDWKHDVQCKFSFQWMMHVLLTTQMLGGKVSRKFRKEWLNWLDSDHLFDAILDADDPKPYRNYRLEFLWRLFRNPRSTLTYLFG